MERFLDEVEEVHSNRLEYQDYVKAGRQAIKNEESIFQRVYDEERLPSVQDIELKQMADKIMEAPDRSRSFLDAWGKLGNGDLDDRERPQRLFKMLADMGFTPAMEQLGNAYATGLIRDRRYVQPDYGVAVSYYLAVGIESLGYDALKNLACIMSDPAKRPREFSGSRTSEIYNTCTEVAKRRGMMKRGWPELKDDSDSDAC